MEPTEPLEKKQDTEEDVVEEATIEYHDPLAIWMLSASTCTLSCVPPLMTDSSLVGIRYLELKQIKEVLAYKKDKNDQRRYSDSFKRINKTVKGLLSVVDVLCDLLQFCWDVLS